MCQVCKSTQVMDLEDALETIGEAIKSGRDPEHFQALLDGLLGTEMEEQDEEMNEAWERKRR